MRNQPRHIPAPTKSVLRNHVAIVLDNSSSIIQLGIKQGVINLFNKTIDDLKDNAKKFKQETSVSLFTFDNTARCIYFNAHPDTAQKLTNQTYNPSGWTAMLDGVGNAFDLFERLPDKDDKNTSFLVIVITDGDENASRKFSAKEMYQLIKERQLTDRWTITFQVPKGNSHYVTNLGIPTDNISEWETTVKGAAVVQTQVSRGLETFYGARSKGLLSVSNFYVEPDLSKVTKKDLKKLDNLTDKYTLYDVKEEDRVKEFSIAKTGKYVCGSVFYQLMKKETVQPTKDVLVRDKKSHTVYGGAEARELIGLPAAKATVEPGNHSNYDIFIKSTSYNRILPRGTKVLIDLSKQSDDAPTWVDPTQMP